MSRYFGWAPYVPVAVRRARAAGEMQKLVGKGKEILPVKIAGRKIANTFWGAAWCDHLESFSDFSNRLPRGRTYVRNGSVCHLELSKGCVMAKVNGSSLYNVEIKIKTLAAPIWDELKQRCAGEIGSLLELLQGRFSKHVMEVVADRNRGLFPQPGEISMKCSCPDWAIMCKHVAAALYGVGARLDDNPELLFLLRGVDHEELIATDVRLGVSSSPRGGRRRIAEAALSEVFGIEVSEDKIPAKSAKKSPARKMKSGEPAAKQASRQISKPLNNQASKGEDGPSQVTAKDIAAQRAKFGMTQKQFASLLEVSLMTVSKWENAPRPIRMNMRSREAWLRALAMSKR